MMTSDNPIYRAIASLLLIVAISLVCSFPTLAIASTPVLTMTNDVDSNVTERPSPWIADTTSNNSDKPTISTAVPTSIRDRANVSNATTNITNINAGLRTSDCTDALYNNGAPDYNNGLTCGRYGSVSHSWILDDMVIYADVTIESLRWIGTMTDDFGFTGTGDILIVSDSGGVPGTVVHELLGVPTTGTPTGNVPWNTPEWEFSIDNLNLTLTAGTYWIGMRPVGSTGTGWSYWLTAPDRGADSYVWNSEWGTGSSWTLALWLWYDDYSMNFCATGTAPTGACCDQAGGTCTDDTDYTDCAPPLTFTPNTTCDNAPSCGIPGACCSPDLTCNTTGFQTDCEENGGRFWPEESCSDWQCPDVCDHRVDLYNHEYSGWYGDRLDVYVDGQLLLDHIYLPSTHGPLSFYFPAGDGSTIETVFTNYGAYPRKNSYKIFDGNGLLLAEDGANDEKPTGVIVAGQCSDTAGACCDRTTCLGTMAYDECADLDGRMFPGESCDSFTCPDECRLSVELSDTAGQGWRGNTLDLYVNGLLTLEGITLSSGAGPESFYFYAAEGDTVETVYNIQNRQYAGTNLYRIRSGADQIIAEDGLLSLRPTGLTIEAYCEWHDDGACCMADNQCELNFPWDCQYGDWQEKATQCASCPCQVICPPASISEPETCGSNDNGGCGNSPPTEEFTEIACGDVICGTAWASTNSRDTDWYQLTTTDFASFEWTVEAEFPVQTYIFAAARPNACDEYTFLNRATGNDCTPVTIQTGILPPGTYWFWVAPEQFGDLDCSLQYTASLNCTAEEPDYCPASGGCDEYILNVEMGSINYTSGCSQYDDVTSLFSTDLSYGASERITVINGHGVYDDDVCTVWIDWNHDFIFDNETEQIGRQTGGGPYTFFATPPDWAQPGYARMRVRINFGESNAGPCGVALDGEVEDYLVNVVPVEGACCGGSNGCEYVLPSECDGIYVGPFTECSNNDCNANGIDDFCDLTFGMAHDCDDNGVPDECQPASDCNNNGIPDFCDIAAATSTDCNYNTIPDSCDLDPSDPDGDSFVSADCQANGIPDECDAATLGGGMIYQWDDGGYENRIGQAAGGYLLTLNHFTVLSGKNRIGALRVAHGPITEGKNIDLYVWDDPNSDGMPDDAVVISHATLEANNDDNYNFVSVPLPEALILPRNSFFVGMIIHHEPGDRPGLLDQTASQCESWITGYSTTPDPNDLSDSEAPLAQVDTQDLAGNWMIRAEVDAVRDCNGNSIPDECEVSPLCTGPNCQQDCNADIIPDVCQLPGNDCNSNGQPDECDLSLATSYDHNANTIPDECEIAIEWGGLCSDSECDHDCQHDSIPDDYQLWQDAVTTILGTDDSVSDDHVGLGFDEGGDLCWIQNFATGEPAIVHSILVTFGSNARPGDSGALPGEPFRVYVWSDPNQDGNPLDAVLLTEVTAQVEPNAIDTDQYQAVPVRTIVDGSFFIGASMHHPHGKYPAPIDTSYSVGLAWGAYNTIPFDPTIWNPDTTLRMDDFIPGNWLLHAELTVITPPHDCNENGWPDQCDIATRWGGLGTTPGSHVADWDNDGIPDVCQGAGDLDNDGDVDLEDYALFEMCLAGPDQSPSGVDPTLFEAADLTKDGDVDLEDFQQFVSTIKEQQQ